MIRSLGTGIAPYFGFHGAWVHGDVLAALVQYLPVRNLLPNLQRLSLNYRSYDEVYLVLGDLPLLQRVLGPSLLFVDINGDAAAANENLSGLLWSMSQTSLHIRKLWIASSGWPVNALDLDALILSLNEVKTIEITEMPAHFF